MSVFDSAVHWLRSQVGSGTTRPSRRIRRSSRLANPGGSEPLEPRLLLSAVTTNAQNVTSPGGQTHQFEVEFNTFVGLNPKSFDSDDLLITGPNGFETFATFTNVVEPDWTQYNEFVQHVGFYEFTPPGGAWTAEDVGVYSIALVAGSVDDVYGESLAPENIGTFAVDFSGNVTNPGIFSLEDADIFVNEDVGTIDVTIHRIDGSDGRVSINYRTSDATTTTNSFRDPLKNDYVSQSGNFTFADGETSRSVSIPITDDTKREGDEYFRLVISGASGGATLGSRDEQNITIIDDETVAPLPAVATLPDFVIPQDTNHPSEFYQFEVAYSAQNAVHPYSIDEHDIIVTGPNGFAAQATPDALTHTTYNGSTTVRYQVSPQDGTWDPEDAGTYTVVLQEDQVTDIDGESIPGGELGSVVIESSTYSPQAPTFGNVTANESDGSVVFSISLGNAAYRGPVSFDYTTVATGSAESGADFQPVSGHITIPHDQSYASIRVPVMGDDQPESEESFQLELTNIKGNVTLPADGILSATATIVDNDEKVRTPGHISIATTVTSIREDDDIGVVLSIRRLGGDLGTVTVDYATSDGTAVNGEDYGYMSGTLTFVDGETEKELVIPLNRWDEAEATEDFDFTLSNPTGGAVLGIANQTIRIEDTADNGILFQTDFDDPAAEWSVDPFQTDTATTGKWGIGSTTRSNYRALATYFFGEYYASHPLQLESSSVLATGITGYYPGINPAGYDDVDGGITSVMSPAIELPADEPLELSFRYNFAHDDNATAEDFLRVSVIGDTSEVILNEFAAATQRTGQWTSFSVDLTQFAGQTIQLLIEAGDQGTGSVIEAAIDSLMVIATNQQPSGFSFQRTNIHAKEASTEVTLTVQRTDVSETASVNYSTLPITADNSDFQSTSETLTFAPGEGSKTIVVAIRNDSYSEVMESFEVTLDTPVGDTIGLNETAVIHIIDDDTQDTGELLPNLSILGSAGQDYEFDTETIPGRVLLRHSTSIVNTGSGPLELWTATFDDGTQSVFQRVYTTTGYYDHGDYRGTELPTNLVKVTTENRYGFVESLSHSVQNDFLPDGATESSAPVPHGRGGVSTDDVQGISVGYGAIIDKNDQWIDVTDYASGDYWMKTSVSFALQTQYDIPRYLSVTIDNPNTVRAAAAFPDFAPSSQTSAEPVPNHTGAGIVVAVIDSGVDLQHRQLASSIWQNSDEVDGDGIDNDANGYVDDVHGYDFVVNDAAPLDESGHGTEVAAVIAAANDGIGVDGVASGASIMSLRVLNHADEGTETNVAEAIRYAVNNGARVISLGLYAGESLQIANALKYASDNDVFVALAAGVTPWASDVGFPGEHTFPTTESELAGLTSVYENVLSVGATNGEGFMSLTSNRVGNSKAVQIDAPGFHEPMNLYSSEFPSSVNGGTSIAAANVAAVAALLLEVNPDLTAKQIREILIESADAPVASSDSQGTLNTVRAIELAGEAQRVSTITGSLQTIVTSDAGEFIYVDAQQRTLSVDGQLYDIGADVTTLAIDANGGNDVLFVRGTDSDDLAVIRPGSIRYTAPSLLITSKSTESITATGGNGGQDVAFLFDSPGNDTYAGKADHGLLHGDGYVSVARGFDQVAAKSTAGGTDHAQFYDSPGDDSYVAKPTYATWSGDGFYHVTTDFSTNRAYAGVGYDVAQFYDSAGDDRYVAKPEYAYLIGAGFYSFGRGFDATAAYSTLGGDDSAQFYDSAEDDLFVGREGISYMIDRNRTFAHTARWFGTVDAFAFAGGIDEVQLYDRSEQLVVELHANKIVKAVSDTHQFGTVGFERVLAVSQSGINRRKQKTGLDYFFKSFGDWDIESL